MFSFNNLFYFFDVSHKYVIITIPSLFAERFFAFSSRQGPRGGSGVNKNADVEILIFQVYSVVWLLGCDRSVHHIPQQFIHCNNAWILHINALLDNIMRIYKDTPSYPGFECYR